MKRIISLLLCVLMLLTVCACGKEKKKEEKNKNKDSSSKVSSVESSSTEPVSSSEPVSSVVESSSSAPVTPPVNPKPIYNHSVSHNSTFDLENNPYYNAFVYTGYNIDKHRADGLMWQYVPGSSKPARGWLSKIGYGGGPSGYEVNAEGKPDIARFERGGLVCATYVGYVYFNYLPNVAGVDVSAAVRPSDVRLAGPWYQAAKQWVAAGLSRQIDFSASGAPGVQMRFAEAEEIPVGSLICLRNGKPGYENSTNCTHVAIYAGYKNNYHWVFHVGNDNGPEFCTIERMTFGPDPQMMLAIFTPPFKT